MSSLETSTNIKEAMLKISAFNSIIITLCGVIIARYGTILDKCMDLYNHLSNIILNDILS